jgi:hypothetical protein
VTLLALTGNYPESKTRCTWATGGHARDVSLKRCRYLITTGNFVADISGLEDRSNLNCNAIREQRCRAGLSHPGRNASGLRTEASNEIRGRKLCCLSFYSRGNPLHIQTINEDHFRADSCSVGNEPKIPQPDWSSPCPPISLLGLHYVSSYLPVRIPHGVLHGSTVSSYVLLVSCTNFGLRVGVVVKPLC